MDYTSVLHEQIQLLEEWNKQYIEDEPEQVRVNVLAIAEIVRFLETRFW